MPVHCTTTGFMIELTLYGQMYGTPTINISAWPFTGTAYCWNTRASAF